MKCDRYDTCEYKHAIAIKRCSLDIFPMCPHYYTDKRKTPIIVSPLDHFPVIVDEGLATEELVERVRKLFGEGR